MFIIESMASVKEGFLNVFDASVWQHEEEGSRKDWTSKRKGKGKANELVNESDDSAGAIDWVKYEPPEALKDVSDANSEIVAQIIQDSIKNVKTRIVEEEERKKAEAEKLKQTEDEAKRDSERGKEIEVPEASLDENQDKSADVSAWPPSPNRNPNAAAMTETPLRGEVETQRSSVPEQRPTRPKKRSLMSIFRRLNHNSEKGETSATGASRHRSQVSSASTDLNTRAGRRSVVLELIKRATTDSSSSMSSADEAEIECVSCLEDFSSTMMIKAPCHSYCPDCFQRLITAACDNEQQWPPKCCLNTIPSGTVILNVDTEIKQRYRDRASEWSIPVSERVYCNEPICGQWVRPHQIDPARNRGRCYAGHWTCTICRGRQHEGEDCPQDRDLARTNELAEEEGWKRCYGCHAFVEHREACQHMTCRCGAEFCYVCGERWRTCGCTMQQLHDIKNGVVARRQIRLDREAREEAEIQEALRLIEEFEREEALKAELLRQEQERLAEERRQRELEERIRREGERRKAVQVKFKELREIFLHLHELQRLLVQSDHDTEENDTRNQGAAALEELREKHKADREKLTTATNSKIGQRERTLEAEYAARVAEERRIREQYHAKLKIYWAGKKNGADKMEEALDELSGKLDKSFGVWKKWMKDELEKHRYDAREEQAIQEELMDAVERRLTETVRGRQDAFAKRKAAELRWVHAVIEERERMLANMEVDEIENGEDIDAWFAEGALDYVAESVLVESASVESDLSQEYRVPGAFAD
ncbi:hypothetical protein F5X99DRAFT_64058 [Biscogniauxia marginata]|nr:hypothetical protein F5X99DRAFT_64058 [Biscogniauxia marginata]